MAAFTSPRAGCSKLSRWGIFILDFRFYTPAAALSVNTLTLACIYTIPREQCKGKPLSFLFILHLQCLSSLDLRYRNKLMASCVHGLLSCDWLTQDLVEYYKQYSLKEGFSSLDTTLQVPYREPSDENRSITKAGSGESASLTPRLSGRGHGIVGNAAHHHILTVSISKSSWFVLLFLGSVMNVDVVLI